MRHCQIKLRASLLGTPDSQFRTLSGNRVGMIPFSLTPALSRWAREGVRPPRVGGSTAGLCCSRANPLSQRERDRVRESGRLCHRVPRFPRISALRPVRGGTIVAVGEVRHADETHGTDRQTDGNRVAVQRDRSLHPDVAPLRGACPFPAFPWVALAARRSTHGYCRSTATPSRARATPFRPRHA